MNAEDEIQTVVLGEKDIGTMDVEVVETDSVGYVLKIRVGDNTISGKNSEINITWHPAVLPCSVITANCG